MRLRTLPAVLTVVAVLLVVSFYSEALGQDPGRRDSLLVDSVVAYTTGIGVLPLNFYNDEFLAGIEVDLKWDSPDIQLDSVSFVGSRVSGITMSGMTSTDSSVIVYCFPSFSEAPILPGSGLLAQLYFSYPRTIENQLVRFENIAVSIGNRDYTTTFSTATAGPFSPYLRSGYLDIQDTTCCVDIRGNVDNSGDHAINVADLTYLVAYLFQGGPPPACNEEGNVDGSFDEAINVADLTYMVSYLFQGGPEPPPCP